MDKTTETDTILSLLEPQRERIGYDGALIVKKKMATSYSHWHRKVRYLYDAMRAQDSSLLLSERLDRDHTEVSQQLYKLLLFGAVELFEQSTMRPITLAEHSLRSQVSFLRPQEDRFAARYCIHLFEDAPPSSIIAGIRFSYAEVKQKFLRFVGRIVRELDQQGTLVPELHAAGRYGRSHGLTIYHFHAAAKALLSSLEEFFGVFWNAYQQAWVDLLTVCLNVIEEGIG